jgi:hypothetical protein
MQSNDHRGSNFAMHRTETHTETTTVFLLDCPQCGLPAQIIDRFTLGGSPGPVEHVKIACLAGHWFTPPADWLRAGEPAAQDNQAEADSAETLTSTGVTS